jgi:hypothetical protein
MFLSRQRSIEFRHMFLTHVLNKFRFPVALATTEHNQFSVVTDLKKQSFKLIPDNKLPG